MLTTAFLCSVYLSEQGTIFALYIVKWLDVLTEMECVYLAVRPEF